jgi:dolichyl-phosphate beta-glucosyltransferase
MFKKDLPMKNSVSIIIPCYNEENNLKRGVLEEVYDFLKSQEYSWEVLICNDESTDNSLSLAKKLSSKYKNFKVLDLPHGGKPSAVWGGIQKAKYPVVLFTDMDQSTPLKELNKLLPYFDKGYDVVIGSRGIVRTGASIVRKIMAQVFLFSRRMVLLNSIIDTQCGFKAIRTDVAKKIFPNLEFFKNKSNSSGSRYRSLPLSRYVVNFPSFESSFSVRYQFTPILIPFFSRYRSMPYFP